MDKNIWKRKYMKRKFEEKITEKCERFKEKKKNNIII